MILAKARIHAGQALTIALLLGYASAAFAQASPRAKPARPAPGPAERIAQSQTAFALDLYAQLRTDEGNLFFSPHSIATALAMTWAGARGETAAQMAKTLRFPADLADIHAAHAALATRLKDAQREGKVALHVANALWPQKDYAFRKEYLQQLERNYSAPAKPVDYRQAAEAARAAINAWVEQQTRDRIKNLIPPGSLDALTRMVLVNAVWFKADWAHPFDAKRTEKAPFHVAPDRKTDVSMMRQTEHFRYAETAGAQVLELPYAGDKLSMLVILPETGQTLSEIEDGLDADTLRAWTRTLRRREVDVHLPKFAMTWGTRSLADALKALGMTDAFQHGAADFSGMDGSRELFVNDVLHKAFVEVDEKGTEAAAATGVVVGITSVPPPPAVFRADRPFLFLIRERQTGAILFMGRLTRP